MTAKTCATGNEINEYSSIKITRVVYYSSTRGSPTVENHSIDGFDSANQLYVNLRPAV